MVSDDLINPNDDINIKLMIYIVSNDNVWQDSIDPNDMLCVCVCVIYWCVTSLGNHKTIKLCFIYVLLLSTYTFMDNFMFMDCAVMRNRRH